MQARRSALVNVLEGDGLVAELGQPERRPPGRAGLITWLMERDALSAEIRAVAVVQASRGRGVGRALFDAAHVTLADAGVRSAWLVTTNDNVAAIHLCESLAYVVVETRRGAIDQIRRTIKPSIPRIGHGGVEMRDEIEMRRPLVGPRTSGQESLI